jgi:ElaB/YqjD/DUF883 family membrane-anchored ribosome-binding protein
MNVQREIEVLRADLRQVRRDLKRVLQGIGSGSKERVADAGSRWWEGGKALEGRLEDHVGELFDDVRGHARHAAHRAKEEAEEHPFVIGLAFAGLALLVFQLLMSRR